MRLALPLAALAVVAAVVRSRRGVEVWHVAVTDPPDDPPGVEGP
ncbi:hypothetical protein [Mycobacterium sp. 1164966.3]|nr:hypothetical protein [Mycobacterium sp. 1164966.3]